MTPKRTLVRLSALVPFILAVALPLAGQPAPTILVPAGTLNNAGSPGVTVTLSPNYSQTFIQFLATFQGVSGGYSVANGTYKGWCADPFAGFNANPSYNLISTYNPAGLNNPPGGGRAQNPNWNAVNWVLNNKPATGAAPTWITQQVIWKLLTGQYMPRSSDQNFFPSPAPATLPLTAADTNAANALYATALTKTSFVPGPGQVAGLLLYIDGINPDGTSTGSNFVVAQNGVNVNAPPLNGLNGRTNQSQEILIEVPVGPGSIGDFVWQDTNQNGVQDAGEPGMNGVNVRLCADSSCSTVLATTTTANHAGNDGYYQFSGLPLGAYFVSVDSAQPSLSGLVPTLTGQGTPSTDSNLIPSMVTLTAGSPADQTVDFGFTSPGSSAIGDLVWQDNNANGIQDNGEPGLSGLTVNLCPDVSCANILRTTMTDQNGAYHFTGLFGGIYYVQVVAGPGFNATTPQAGYPGNAAFDSGGNVLGVPTEVSLPVGYTDNTIDFGFIPPAQGAIGDFVWLDMNSNGIQDAGEPGINNVTLQLYDSNNNLLATTTTITSNGQDGYYQFTGLAAGTYTVKVDNSTVSSTYAPATVNAAGSSAGTDSNAAPASVALPTNISKDQTVDFGFVPPCTGVIGDLVWNDLNNNGIQDAGEPGIPGVKVNLYGPNHVFMTSTTTDLNGTYHFNGLCAGAFTVEVVPPAGYVASPSLQGGNLASDSNGSPAAVTLLQDNSADSTIDFGYYQLGNLTTNVFNDLNNNTIRDSGEPNLPGWTITTTGPNGYSNTGVTDAGGNVLLTDLYPGVYQVCITAQATWNQTVPAGLCQNVTVIAGQTAGDVFGELQLGALTTNVFNDVNQNGGRDGGEIGLAGWTVNTTGPGSYANSGVTDAAGNVSLSGLTPGAYQVCLTQQADWTETYPAGVCQSVTVVANQTVTDLFGEVQLGNLTTNVFNDLNQNGAKDAGESNLSGWTVATTGPGGFNTTGVTDANGNVSLTNLTPGSYTVCITQQAGWTGTTPASACQNVTVNANQTATDQFGEVQLGNLTTNVFNDLNKNMAKDAGESNLAGWTITTTGPNSYSNAGATDANGNVALTGLTPGAYQVCITQQATWTETTPASTCQNVTVAANQTATDFFGEVQLGSLTANVFNDLNQNTTKDAGESNLAGWTITTTGPSGYANTGTTDVNGNVSLTGLTPGSYQVCITQQASWTETTPAGLCQNLTVVANQTVSGIFGEVQLGNLTTNVFNDLNKNAAKDAGEANLAGWTITTTGPGGYTNTGSTDVNGNVSLTGLTPGAYQVCITQQASWTQTTPAGLCQNVTVIANQTATDVFGEVQSGALTTNVFNDLNKNAAKDAGEANLAGWTITTTGPGGYSNTGSTDANGNVALTGLTPGAYQVCITQQPTWIETTPASTCQNVNVVANQTATDVFGEVQSGALTTNVFNDLNKNAAKDAGEANLAGWTIITTGPGGYTNTGSTDGNGNVSLTGLTPGAYQVCITQQPTWTETTPASTCQSVTVVANQTATDVFGEVQSGALTTNVFNDLNKNAAKDAGEANLAGWTITTTGPAGYTNTGSTDGNGNVSLTGLTPGAYQVCITQQASWTETTPASACQNVTVVANQTATDFFGEVQSGALTTNVFNDLNKNAAKDAGEANLAGWTITTTGPAGYTNTGSTDVNGNVSLTGLTPGAYQVCVTQQPTWIETTPASACQSVNVVANQTATDIFGEVQSGALTTNVFNDLNKNAAKDAGEANLAGWTITTTGPGGYTNTGATNASGNVSLTGLTPGIYQVCITQQPTWTETTPASTCQSVTVVANQTATDIFGEVQSGALTTNVFNDLNKNAAKDAGEANLAGWTITTTGPGGYTNTGATNASGNVSLTGLTPGIYQVCITQQPAWTETTPASTCQNVTVVANQTATDFFGEVLPPPPALVVTCASGTGQVGVAYHSGVGISGGTAPYVATLAAGALPAGLTLNGDGTITGTPTGAGTFGYTIKVTDSLGMTAFSNCSSTCTTGGAVTVTLNMASTLGSLGASKAYSVGGAALTAYGFTGSNPAATGTPTNLWAKNESATEKGLGIDSDIDNEINTSTFIQLDISQLVAAGITNPQILLNSVQSGESWVIYGSNTLGVLGTKLSSGTTGNSFIAMPGFGTWKYIGVQAGSGNILIDSLAFTVGNCKIVIAAPVDLQCGTCVSNKVYVGTPYSASLYVSGGTGPYTYSIVGGALPAGLTLNASTGAITGTPTTPGTYTFTSQVVDANGGTDTSICTIVVAAPPINLICGSCGASKAYAGTPYTASLSVDGGVGPYVYSIVSGSLPAGLTLNPSTGAVTGTPTTPGTYTFTSKVIDSKGGSDTATCTIVVLASPVNLDCGTCGASKAYLGTPYSAAFAATGGSGPYTYSIVQGSLPNGLTLNPSTGAITGTPTVAGTYSFTAKAVDSKGNSDTSTCAIVVAGSPINLDCGSCGAGSPGGKVGSPYSAVLTVTGGTGPYTYSIVSGSLPAGLTLSASTGKITGTPTTAGSYTFTSKVVDAKGNSDTTTCAIVVTGSPINLDCGTCGAGKATVGTAYSATFAVTGGTGPFTYSIASGSLPGGLSLGSGTGKITGTPTSAGTYTFTTKVTDSKGNSDTVVCTIVVVGSPVNLVCGSCGSAAGSVGSTYSAALSVTGGTGPYTYSVASGSLPAGLSLNSATGGISGTPTTAGTYTFTSKVVDSKGNSDTTVCTIVVAAAAVDLECGTCGASRTYVGKSYSAALAATGGSGAYTYSLAAGSLPPGLSLSAAGKITGTPTTAGTFTFTSKVVDSRGKSDTATCAIVVLSPVDLQCGACGASKATVGVGYSIALPVTGGTAPYTFSIASGSLPAGLILNAATGKITGTPTAAGTFTFTTRVVDAGGNSDTSVCTIVVVAPVNLECGACGASKATQNVGYSATFALTGGSGTYTFSIASGSLPPGIALNATTGKLSGTPTATGTYTFTSKVVDSNGSSDTTTCTIAVSKY